jgi:hypothetical protein
MTTLHQTVLALADAQLVAYNQRDLDAFCVCFSDEVLVLDEEGTVIIEGIAAFRERYRALFERWHSMGAEILARLRLEPHIVEHERYFRKDAHGLEEFGEVLVRYTRVTTTIGDRIGLVEFLRAERRSVTTSSRP